MAVMLKAVGDGDAAGGQADVGQQAVKSSAAIFEGAVVPGFADRRGEGGGVDLVDGGWGR
jgi:hypothetical protein